MFRIIRVPPALDKVFQSLSGHVHWDHFTYFRLLVLAIAVMWGRRNVANLYQYLEAEHHRTRFNNFFLVEHWDPEAALRQKAQALVRALRSAKGETLYFLLDDSKKAKRGQAMDAVATMKDPTSDVLFRGQVIPFGIRLSVKKAQCAALELPCRTTTEWAAPLIQACQAPGGARCWSSSLPPSSARRS